MEKKPNVLLNYIYSLSYKLLAILIPVITTPYISRALKAEAIGAFSYTQSIATYFAIFGVMGLDMYGQLQISKNRIDKIELSKTFWEIFVAKLITSFLALLAYFVIVITYNKYKMLLTIMAVMLIANAIDISWFYQGLENFKKIIIRNYIIKLVTLILIFMVVKTEKDIILYALIIQGSTLIGNISLWYKVKDQIGMLLVSWEAIVSHIKNSLIYFLPAIATTVYTSTDKVMLGFLLNSDYQNGIYDQAHKIEQVIITVISSLGIVLLPRLSYLHSNGNQKEMDKYIKNAVKITGLLAVPMTCGLFGIADVFIPVFLGKEFTDAIILVRIFSIMILFSGINTIIGNSCLIAQNKQKYYNIGVVMGALVNIILNFILIIKFQSVGAAIASLFSEIVVFCVFVHYSFNKNITIKKILGYWYEYFILGIPMGITVWIIGYFSAVNIIVLVSQILIGAFIYFALLLLLLKVKNKNLLQ